MSQKQYIGMIASEDLSTAQYKIVNVSSGENMIALRVAAGAGVLGVLNLVRTLLLQLVGLQDVLQEQLWVQVTGYQ